MDTCVPYLEDGDSIPLNENAPCVLGYCSEVNFKMILGGSYEGIQYSSLKSALKNRMLLAFSSSSMPNWMFRNYTFFEINMLGVSSDRI